MHTIAVSILKKVFTIAYSGSLDHYTRHPITEICANQHDPEKLRVLLHTFKLNKTYELNFVRRAAALSAAAVIGCFSWPDVENSFWLGKLLWHCSLWLSIFALISSMQEQMLSQIPDKILSLHITNSEVLKLVRVMLRPPRQTNAKPAKRSEGIGNEMDGEKGVVIDPTALEVHPVLLYVWQGPLMLMNYSWVTFLMGYECYILTPLINKGEEKWSVARTNSVIATVVGLATVTHFFTTTQLVEGVIRTMKLDGTYSPMEHIKKTAEEKIGAVDKIKEIPKIDDDGLFAGS